MAKSDIIAVIDTHKDLLPANLPGIDFAKLLLAISGVESSYGTNAIPRHEDSWCPNQHGKAASTVAVLRHRRWGCEACCSWGPWQILYHTAADRGFTGAPHQLTDPLISIHPVADKLKSAIKEGAKTIAEFADAWNSGTSRDSLHPLVYIAKLEKEYAAL